MSNRVKKIYGIDLGTTYSCIAHVDEYGRPVVLSNFENQSVTPSVVFFDDDNIIVGKIAKENSKIFPDDVVSFIKRSMGDPNFIFEHGGVAYKPEEISAYILRKLVGDAEQSLGDKITDVVITCPAYFGINEREATKRSGEIAGLNVRQIINEPTAAAIHYGETEIDKEKVVLVYDLGGGTFDITMIDIKSDSIKVICTGGDHNLGGKDWDDAIVQYLVEQFQEKTGSDEDILDDSDTLQDLQLSAENAKTTLSQKNKAFVSVTHGGQREKIELTKEKFCELTRHLLEKSISLMKEMLEQAKEKGYGRFDEILLVGGSTRMPQVAERIAEEFSIEPRLFDPDEAVAKGAAQYGLKMSINDGLIRRIAQTMGKSVEEIENTSLDEISPEIIDNASRNLADDSGYTLAAVKRSQITIRNVSSKSFGVIALSNDTEVIVNLILKNETLPAAISQEFGTNEENQEKVEIKIMENESTDVEIPVEQGKEIGIAVLDLPKGLPRQSPINVTFTLNEEGQLEMTAVEETEQRSVDATIQTACVIHGKEFEAARERSKSMVVS